jgi:hypothetical protein
MSLNVLSNSNACAFEDPRFSCIEVGEGTDPSLASCQTAFKNNLVMGSHCTYVDGSGMYTVDGIKLALFFQLDTLPPANLFFLTCISIASCFFP